MFVPLIAFIGLRFFFLAGRGGLALRSLAEMSILDESDLPIDIDLRKLQGCVVKMYRKNIQIGYDNYQNGYFL